MTNLDHYKKIQREIKDIIDLLGIVGKRAIRDFSVGFFERHPEIEHFSWTQYTPYWNDGDLCEFSAHTEYPEFQYYDGMYESAKERAVEREIAEFMKNFDEDHFKVMFGDHVEVKVLREGIQVSEYDHE